MGAGREGENSWKKAGDWRAKKTWGLMLHAELDPTVGGMG